jgi:plasmid maintenance system antidote protein VapI
MNRLAPITGGKLLQAKFFKPLCNSQLRLAKAIGLPASCISEIVTG